MQAERGERLHVRLGIDALLAAIAPVLASHHFVRRERAHGSKRPVLLVAQRVDVAPDRRLHRQQGDELEEMILHDVANGADFVIETASPFHAELFPPW